MFKHILVAIDGSDTADLALQQAIKLAKEGNAQLRIVHVIDVVKINLGAKLATQSVLEHASATGEEILRQAVAVAREAGIVVETQLLIIEKLGQRVPQMIATHAEEWPADLIVICTHGRSGISHLFLGSVAEGVMRVANTPVLLIRGK